MKIPKPPFELASAAQDKASNILERWLKESLQLNLFEEFNVDVTGEIFELPKKIGFFQFRPKGIISEKEIFNDDDYFETLGNSALFFAQALYNLVFPNVSKLTLEVRKFFGEDLAYSIMYAPKGTEVCFDDGSTGILKSDMYQEGTTQLVYSIISTFLKEANNKFYLDSIEANEGTLRATKVVLLNIFPLLNGMMRKLNDRSHVETVLETASNNNPLVPLLANCWGGGRSSWKVAAVTEFAFGEFPQEHENLIPYYIADINKDPFLQAHLLRKIIARLDKIPLVQGKDGRQIPSQKYVEEALSKAGLDESLLKTIKDIFSRLAVPTINGVSLENRVFNYELPAKIFGISLPDPYCERIADFIKDILPEPQKWGTISAILSAVDPEKHEKIAMYAAQLLKRDNRKWKSSKLFKRPELQFIKTEQELTQQLTSLSAAIQESPDAEFLITAQKTCSILSRFMGAFFRESALLQQQQFELIVCGKAISRS